jgi:hypothetical protein
MIKSSNGTCSCGMHDKGLVPNLPRGRGRSIGGNLDVDEEGSKQMIITFKSLHHGSVGHQHVCKRVGLAKKAYPCKRNQEHKSCDSTNR